MAPILWRLGRERESIRTSKNISEKLYPEIGAGGFSHVDATIEFYSRINALLRPEMTVLDFGAGRGTWAYDDPLAYRRNLRTLKGKVNKVIGIDIDPEVKTNPSLDDAHVVGLGDALPLDDASVDLIISDVTFEHIDDATFTAHELTRVLKTGGWLCARTPNRWGYIGIGANLVPNNLHVPFIRILQPGRKATGVFPTRYRMNTRRGLRRLFKPKDFDSFIYTVNPEPAYFANSEFLWRLMVLSYRLTPSAFDAVLLIFLRKR